MGWNLGGLKLGWAETWVGWNSDRLKLGGMKLRWAEIGWAETQVGWNFLLFSQSVDNWTDRYLTVRLRDSQYPIIAQLSQTKTKRSWLSSSFSPLFSWSDQMINALIFWPDLAPEILATYCHCMAGKEAGGGGIREYCNHWVLLFSIVMHCTTQYCTICFIPALPCTYMSFTLCDFRF